MNMYKFGKKLWEKQNGIKDIQNAKCIDELRYFAHLSLEILIKTTII